MIFGLDWRHWLVLASTGIILLAGIGYVRDTLAGRVQPNRVSWGLWAAAPLIATGAAISAQADPWATLRIFIAGFVPLLVFCASFVNRRSYWKLSRFDIACGVLSAAALATWMLAKSPVLAILLAAIADGFAALPTLAKAWRHPESESGAFYGLAMVASLIVLPAIPEWTIENAAFQIYLLLVSALLLAAIYRKGFRRTREESAP